MRNVINRIKLFNTKKKELSIEEIHSFYIENGIVGALTFDFREFKKKTLNFVSTMKIDQYKYKYSRTTTSTNLYASVYACMILGMFDEIDNLTENEKREWADYFDSFQNPDDGLFYDPILKNDIYNDTDWWGARHLSAIILMAYDYLGFTPQYSFNFEEEFLARLMMKINETDWSGPISHSNDIDNFLMNVLIMMIYERDNRGNKKYDYIINEIICKLQMLLNKSTGMWGNYNLLRKDELSRMIQFYYHLLPIFLHEEKELHANPEEIIEKALQTQNIIGGFGVKINSSACEDIDSIYVLASIGEKCLIKKELVKISLLKAFPWVLSNQNIDGGFVFRRNSGFQYGHVEMSSKSNESEMHATWFRTLSIAFITKYLGIENSFKINKELLSYSYIKI